MSWFRRRAEDYEPAPFRPDPINVSELQARVQQHIDALPGRRPVEPAHVEEGVAGGLRGGWERVDVHPGRDRDCAGAAVRERGRRDRDQCVGPAERHRQHEPLVGPQQLVDPRHALDHRPGVVRGHDRPRPGGQRGDVGEVGNGRVRVDHVDVQAAEQPSELAHPQRMHRGVGDPPPHRQPHHLHAVDELRALPRRHDDGIEIGGVARGVRDPLGVALHPAQVRRVVRGDDGDPADHLAIAR